MNRLYLYGGAVLAVLLTGFWAGWAVNGWRLDSREKAAVEAARTAERLAQQNVIDTLKADIRSSQEASNEFQAEINRLRATAALQPIPAVRVSKPARCPPADLPAPSTAARGSGAGAETGGLVPPDAPGGDLAPTLELLVQEGDRCSAQLRSLIGWVEATRRGNPESAPAHTQ